MPVVLAVLCNGPEALAVLLLLAQALAVSVVLSHFPQVPQVLHLRLPHPVPQVPSTSI